VPRAHGFEYKRNGTLSLFAALNTATGEVLGMTAPRHTSEQFVSFLGDVVDTQPQGREMHVICDNVSSHKTELVEVFLAEHENVRIHYTPTYSSWLNQIENWFSRIQRDRPTPMLRWSTQMAPPRSVARRSSDLRRRQWRFGKIPGHGVRHF
jgi:transposase